MSFVLRSLCDPAPEQIPLLRGKFEPARGRRHLHTRILGVDPPPQLALIQMSGDDCKLVLVRTTSCERASSLVQPQLGLACLFVRAMALETGIGENGSDLEIEVDGVLGQGLRGRGWSAATGSSDGREQQAGKRQNRRKKTIVNRSCGDH